MELQTCGCLQLAVEGVGVRTVYCLKRQSLVVHALLPCTVPPSLQMLVTP